MEDTQTLLKLLGAGGIVALFFLYIRLKNTLKKEIVDPDIQRLEDSIKSMKKEMSEKVSRIEENTSHSVANLERKLDEMNVKFDVTSQKVSQMQGMLTAMFNGLQGNNNNYGQ